MQLLLLAALVAMVSKCYCGLNTVTEEVWFEVRVKDLDGPNMDYNGRFTIALFGDTAPMTVLNFVSISKGFKRGSSSLHYKGSLVHRIVRDFVIQMGDVTTKDGTGTASIYGEKFNDEEFLLSHRSAGWVGMANMGPDSNGSQFYITLNKARWMDGKHVVFGKVVQGFDVIETLGEVNADSNTNTPFNEIEITNCGVVGIQKKYDITPAQLDDTSDL